MKMKSLFDDFKMYVDTMEVQDIKDNIADAIEHTSNSYILDGQMDVSMNNYMNSSAQKILPVYHSKKTYSFCSVDTLYSNMSFNMIVEEDWAA